MIREQRGRASISRSQAEPGNEDLEAQPPDYARGFGGSASGLCARIWKLSLRIMREDLEAQPADDSLMLDRTATLPIFLCQEMRENLHL